ncbi:MAG: hypothetical protein J5734_00015 [Prevotella sp.]|nr:hypothetical protein [Prevotella sp.]
MKTYLLSLFTLLFAATASGQTVNRPVENMQLAPLSKVTADKHGIIRDQPDGDYRIYVREGRATYAPVYFVDEKQDGIVAEVVFSDDGKKVWIKNIMSHATTYTWVEGDVDGNTITMPLGQMVYWGEDWGYGMRLARVKVNGDIKKYTVETKGSVTFTIDGNTISINDTFGDDESNTYDGLGLVYTDAYEGEWSYYLDYETVLTYVDELPVTPPAGLQTETYSMENQNNGHLMQVGFDGTDVYLQNVTESKLTTSWMKGTFEDGKVTFPAQCAGIGGSFIYYFCGINGERVDDGYGGYTWIYDWPAGDLVFDFDESTNTFTTDQTLLLTTSLNANDGRGEIFHMPRLRPYEEHAGTPKDPKVIYYQTYGQNVFSIAMFEVPLQDTEGNFMDPAKLSYQLFVDDEEPYTLYTDEYSGLTENMDEIPYLFSDKKGTIIEKAYGIYIYQSGFDRFGIQSIYRGGGEEHRSNIGWWYFNEPEGIETVADSKTEVPTVAFDLQGRRVAPNHKGIVITRMSDGRVVKKVQR